MRVYKGTGKGITTVNDYWIEQPDGRYKKNGRTDNFYVSQRTIDEDVKNGFYTLVGQEFPGETISVDAMFKSPNEPFKAHRVICDVPVKPFKKATKSMSMTIDGRLATYIDGVVKYRTSYGAEIEVRHPESWAITRVAQFMESLLKTELV